jgi:hypothetical protein
MEKSGENGMPDIEHLKARVEELARRPWDLPAMEARYRRLLLDGIAPKTLDARATAAGKAGILDRIQRRAEEYEYLGHN